MTTSGWRSTAFRQAEYPLGDDVALDLGGAAGDRGREIDEELAHPEAAAALGVQDHAVGALELHAELEERLAELGGGELQKRVLGRAAALREAREPLVPERPPARRLVVGGGEPSAHRRIAMLTGLLRELDEHLERVLDGRHALHPEAPPLVRTRAERDAPPVVQLADQ